MSKIKAGTTTTTAYQVEADTTGTLVLQTGATPTTAVTIDTSQNLGIGTTSPSTTLHVSSASNPAFILNRSVATGDAGMRFESTGTEVAQIIGAYGGSLRFSTGSSYAERMRIDSSGNLLVGTTTAVEKLTVAGSVAATGYVYPNTDNNYSTGLAGKRWSVVYAATGTINTSDAREKTAVASLTQSEINAAKQLAAEVGSYKWLAAIEEKGDAARQHIGMTVQRAIEIMKSNGLTPFNYGFICYDEWEDKFVKDKDGNDVLNIAAGNRFSFRMDELSLFISRGQQAAIQEQQALITQLQAQLTAVSTDVAALKGAA